MSDLDVIQEIREQLIRIEAKIENSQEKHLELEKRVSKLEDNIPIEWYIDKDIQITYYKRFILVQKELVKHIIQNLAFKNAFTNYKGGILKWNNQKQEFHTVL